MAAKLWAQRAFCTAAIEMKTKRTMKIASITTSFQPTEKSPAKPKWLSGGLSLCLTGFSWLAT